MIGLSIMIELDRDYRIMWGLSDQPDPGSLNLRGSLERRTRARKNPARDEWVKMDVKWKPVVKEDLNYVEISKIMQDIESEFVSKYNITPEDHRKEVSVAEYLDRVNGATKMYRPGTTKYRSVL